MELKVKRRAVRLGTSDRTRSADWYEPGESIGDWEAEDLAWELSGAEPPQWLVDGMLSEFEGAKVRQVDAIVNWAKGLSDAPDLQSKWRAVQSWAKKRQRQLFPEPDWDEAGGRGHPATARKGRSRTAVDPNKFRGMNPGDRVSTPDGKAGVVVQLGSENRELFNGSPYVVIRIDEAGATQDETYPVDQVRTSRRSFKLPPIRIDKWEHRVEGQSRRGKITRKANGVPIRGVIRGRIRRAAKRAAEEECPHPASRNYAGVADDATSSTGRTVWVGCRDCGEIIAEYDAPAVKPAGRGRRTAGPNDRPSGDDIVIFVHEDGSCDVEEWDGGYIGSLDTLEEARDWVDSRRRRTNHTGAVWIDDGNTIYPIEDSPGQQRLFSRRRSGARRRRTAAPQPQDPAREDYDDLYQRTVERYQEDPNVTPEAVEQAVEKAWEMDDPSDAGEEVDEHVDVFLGKDSRRLNLPCPECRGKTARQRANPNLFVCKSERCGCISEVVL